MARDTSSASRHKAMRALALAAAVCVSRALAPGRPAARRRSARRRSSAEFRDEPEQPDWEAMYAGSSSPEPWSAGAAGAAGADANDDDAKLWGVTAVSASAAVAARDGWEPCRAALEAKGLAVDVGAAPPDGGGAWCRVGDAFREDVLAARAAGMRSVFFLDGDDDDDGDDVVIDVGEERRPPTEGSTSTFTAMGSKTYCRDAVVADFADAVVRDFSELEALAASWGAAAPAPAAEDTVASVVAAVAGAKYVELFEREEILDLDTLALLSAEDLRDLGLPLGPRTKLRAFLGR